MVFSGAVLGILSGIIFLAALVLFFVAGFWLTRSNAELGEGYSDIVIITPGRIGIIIELKYADDGNLEKACADAMKQIEDRKYAVDLERRRMKKILKYGMAFCEKTCKVVLARTE